MIRQAPKLTEPAEKLLTDELRKFNEQIAAKQAELQSVNTDVKAAKIRRGQAERRLKETQAKHDSLVADYVRREKECNSQLDDLHKSVDEGNASIQAHKAELSTQSAAAQAELKAINKDISNRGTYLKEQEHLIHDTLADGEARLADLDYEVKHILKQRRETLEKNGMLEADNTVLQVAIAEHAAKRKKLDEVYSGAAAQYKRTLEELYAKIEQQAEKYKVQLAAAKTLATRLTTKEHELDGREKVLEEREKKVEEDRRFMESRKYMYGNQ